MPTDRRLRPADANNHEFDVGLILTSNRLDVSP